MGRYLRALLLGFLQGSLQLPGALLRAAFQVLLHEQHFFLVGEQLLVALVQGLVESG